MSILFRLATGARAPALCQRLLARRLSSRATGCAPLPFAWPEKSGPSSRVIRSAGAWQDQSLLIPHECFHWLHGELRCALDNFDPRAPGQEWQAQAMRGWLKTYFLESVHHHHDAEELVYNPWLGSRGAKIPPKIASDHRELLAVIETCLDLGEAVARGAPEAVDCLKERLTKLMDMLEEHFAEEEAYYPSLLRELGVTRGEEGKVVGAIFQDMSLEGTRAYLPIIVYAAYMWGGPKVVEDFKRNLPLPAQRMLEEEWVGDFHRNNLSVIRKLQGRAGREGHQS